MNFLLCLRMDGIVVLLEHGYEELLCSETKLLAQLEITYEDGSMDVVATDDRFVWTNDGPIRFADNKDGEIYDATKQDFFHA